MSDRLLAAVARRVDALERTDGLLAATFADTATGAGDTLRVLVEGYDDGEHYHGDPEGVVWAPRVNNAGNAVFPAEGDTAYVMEASDGRWVVVAWTAG